MGACDYVIRPRLQTEARAPVLPAERALLVQCPSPLLHLFFSIMRRVLPRSLKHLVVRHANPQARQLVLGLVAQNGPMTVQELYKLTTKQQEQQQQSQEASTSDPDLLPVPSMRYAAQCISPRCTPLTLRPGPGT